MCKSTAGGKLNVSCCSVRCLFCLVISVQHLPWPRTPGLLSSQAWGPEAACFSPGQLPVLGWQTARWHPASVSTNWQRPGAGYFQSCILIFLLVETAPSTPPWIWILCYNGLFHNTRLIIAQMKKTQMWMRFSLYFNLGDGMQWFNNDLLFFLPFRLSLKEQCVFLHIPEITAELNHPGGPILASPNIVGFCSLF